MKNTENPVKEEEYDNNLEKSISKLVLILSLICSMNFAISELICSALTGTSSSSCISEAIGCSKYWVIIAVPVTLLLIWACTLRNHMLTCLLFSICLSAVFPAEIGAYLAAVFLTAHGRIIPVCFCILCMFSFFEVIKTFLEQLLYKADMCTKLENVFLIPVILIIVLDTKLFYQAIQNSVIFI